MAAALGSVPAEGVSWQDITQPIGNLIRLWDTTGAPPLPLQPPSRIPPFTAPTTPVGEVNYITAQWDFNEIPSTPPFDLGTAVTEIVLTAPQHYVRLYTPNLGSSPNGVWIMRSEYVRGLTPEQLKDRFALPNTPTAIVNVDLPASPNPVSGKDYALWTGIAGPIAGFGEGGAVQNRIVSDFNGTHYFPDYAFFVGVRDHPQPIGNIALSYRPMAGSGNTQHIAAYLDQYIPQAYSDLENVYTALDYLNWVAYGPDPIRQALNQIGPQDYNAVTFVVTRNSLLFSDALFERCRLLRACRHRCACDPCGCADGCDSEDGIPRFSLQGVGEYMHVQREHHQAGFNDRTGGAVGTFDCLPAEDLAMGISVAGMDSYLKWQQERGSAHIASAKLALYGSYSPFSSCLGADFHVDGLITGGYSWTKAHRSIEFPGVDRQADSRQTGYDVAVHMLAGCDLPLCSWQISPLARLSYFYAHQNGFTEHGADSLDLEVRGCNAQTLRTNLGVGISRACDFACVEIIPQIYVAWIHDRLLDNRTLTSRLKDLGGSFKVHGFNRDRNGLLGAAGLMLRHANGMAAEGCYDIEIDEHFISQSVKLSLSWCF